jgi:hypothetical protein
LGEYSQCNSNKIGASSTFSFGMCKLEKYPQILKVLPTFQNHNIERKKNFKQAIV